MSTNKTLKLDGDTVVTICAISVVVCIMALFAYVAFSSPVSSKNYQENYNVCLKFTQYIDGLTTQECTSYLKENPNATGQEIIDAYVIPLDQMLYGPLLP